MVIPWLKLNGLSHVQVTQQTDTSSQGTGKTTVEWWWKWANLNSRVELDLLTEKGDATLFFLLFFDISFSMRKTPNRLAAHKYWMINESKWYSCPCSSLHPFKHVQYPDASGIFFKFFLRRLGSLLAVTPSMVDRCSIAWDVASRWAHDRGMKMKNVGGNGR